MLFRLRSDQFRGKFHSPPVLELINHYKTKHVQLLCFHNQVMIYHFITQDRFHLRFKLRVRIFCEMNRNCCFLSWNSQFLHYRMSLVLLIWNRQYGQISLVDAIRNHLVLGNSPYLLTPSQT